MAKKMQQIHFNATSSYPSVSATSLVSGSAFASYVLGGIEQLGIQAVPGTKFFLNNSPDPIVIGTTGIYELDLTNQSSITELRFHADSIANIKNSKGVLSLLIDIIYRGE